MTNLYCYRGPLCHLPLSNRAAQLFRHTIKPVSSRLLVSPECFAGRMKFFCGPHVRHPCSRCTIDGSLESFASRSQNLHYRLERRAVTVCSRPTCWLTSPNSPSAAPRHCPLVMFLVLHETIVVLLLHRASV